MKEMTSELTNGLQRSSLPRFLRNKCRRQLKKSRRHVLSYKHEKRGKNQKKINTNSNQDAIGMNKVTQYLISSRNSLPVGEMVHGAKWYTRQDGFFPTRALNILATHRKSNCAFCYYLTCGISVVFEFCSSTSCA